MSEVIRQTVSAQHRPLMKPHQAVQDSGEGFGKALSFPGAHNAASKRETLANGDRQEKASDDISQKKSPQTLKSADDVAGHTPFKALGDALARLRPGAKSNLHPEPEQKAAHSAALEDAKETAETRSDGIGSTSRRIETPQSATGESAASTEQMSDDLADAPQPGLKTGRHGSGKADHPAPASRQARDDTKNADGATVVIDGGTATTIKQPENSTGEQDSGSLKPISGDTGHDKAAADPAAPPPPAPGDAGQTTRVSSESGKKNPRQAGTKTSPADGAAPQPVPQGSGDEKAGSPARLAGNNTVASDAPASPPANRPVDENARRHHAVAQPKGRTQEDVTQANDTDSSSHDHGRSKQAGAVASHTISAQHGATRNAGSLPHAPRPSLVGGNVPDAKPAVAANDLQATNGDDTGPDRGDAADKVSQRHDAGRADTRISPDAVRFEDAGQKVKVVNVHTAPVVAPAAPMSPAANAVLGSITSEASANPAFAPSATGTATPGQPRPDAMKTLQIELNPASLGVVTAKLRLVGERLNVDLQVDSAAAHHRLKTDSDAIVKSLQAAGFDVDKVTVQQMPSHGMNASGNQAGAAPGRDQSFQQQTTGDEGGKGDNSGSPGNGGQQGNGAQGHGSSHRDQARGDHGGMFI